MCCQKLNYRTLSKMAENAKWCEAMWIGLGERDLANKYHFIWIRIMESMIRNLKENGVY